jgi:TolA-binding protein
MEGRYIAMKTLKTATAASILIAGFVILVSAVAYAGQTDRDDKTTSKDVKKETKEALQAIKTYSFEQRDKAVKDVKAVLNDLDGRIDRMQGRIEQKWDEMDQASRTQLRNTMTTLRAKRNQLSEWYGGLQHSSANAWDHVKAGFVEGYDSVARAFEKAENEFNSDGKK